MAALIYNNNIITKDANKAEAFNDYFSSISRVEYPDADINMPIIPTEYELSKARRKRESKNAKQMRNTKQNCFSDSSASPRNNKQCSAKQCFANQTNRCLADFASRSDLFLDNEHG